MPIVRKTRLSDNKQTNLRGNIRELLAAIGRHGGIGAEPAPSRQVDVVEELERIVTPAEDPSGSCHAKAFQL
jgi:hypothetical protein